MTRPDYYYRAPGEYRYRVGSGGEPFCAWCERQATHLVKWVRYRIGDACCQRHADRYFGLDRPLRRYATLLPITTPHTAVPTTPMYPCSVDGCDQYTSEWHRPCAYHRNGQP